MALSRLPQLLSLCERGFWPGPDENAEQFEARVAYSLQIGETLATAISQGKAKGMALPLYSAAQACPKAVQRLKDLLDCAPSWVPVFYSNRRLPFWQGACAWIFELEPKAPRCAALQLKRSLAYRGRLLKLYPREEIVAHELAHVGRLAFDEPRFEELLAYTTSLSAFRRYFGGIFQSTREVGILLAVCALLFFFQSYAFVTNSMWAKEASDWVLFAPLFLAVYGIARLWRRQEQLRSCLDNIARSVENPKKALAIAYRLRDSEIALFSKMDPEAIKTYARQEADQSLRWQLIETVYFG